MVQIVNIYFYYRIVEKYHMKFKSWRMVCKIFIPIDFLFKKYNAIGNVPYLLEYGYFPTVINVYFSANCLHFFRRANGEVTGGG